MISGAFSQSPDEKGGFNQGIKPGRNPQIQQIGLMNRRVCGSQKKSTRTPGIHNDGNVTITLRTPRAHDEIRRACGRTPVDISRIVSAHVFAKRIKFCAGAAQRCCRCPLELMKSCEARRKEFPRPELRQNLENQGSGTGNLTCRKPQGSPEAHRNIVGLLAAATFRAQHRRDRHVFASRNHPRMMSGSGMERGRPRIADTHPYGACEGIGNPHGTDGFFIRAYRAEDFALIAQTSWICSAEKIHQTHEERAENPPPGHGRGRKEENREDSRQNNERRAPGQSHQRGTGTCWSSESRTVRAVSPSSSASGRKLRRCASVD